MKNKILDSEKLKKVISFLKKKKRIIGLSHGVFDLIHLGHIKHFEEARKSCDILIVSITDDAYVKKGPGRPVFSSYQRLESVAALELVDYAVLSEDHSSVEVINIIKPNFYFKGPDYKDNKDDLTRKIFLENKAVKKNYGKTIYTSSEKFSSSSILNHSSNYLNKNLRKIKKIIKINSNSSEIKNFIHKFSNDVPLIIGETIIDQYFFCEALGKSGKEPMLVLKDLYNEKYLGGAAAISRHLSGFCKKINFISMIGEKKEYFHFIRKNIPKNVNYFFLNKKSSPTIIKKRFLDYISKSKVLGVYSLDDTLIKKFEEKKLISIFNKYNKNSDLVIISDYGHGFITPTLIKAVKHKSRFIAVNAQVNAANIGYHTLRNYKSVDLIIINENEIRHEMRSKNTSILDLMKQLSTDMDIKYLVVTRGSSGCILYEKINKKFYYSDAYASTIVDKVGAGDAMLSILAICLYNKIEINLSLLISSFSAAQKIKSIGNKYSIDKVDLLKELEHFLS